MNPSFCRVKPMKTCSRTVENRKLFSVLLHSSLLDCGLLPFPSVPISPDCVSVAYSCNDWLHLTARSMSWVDYYATWDYSEFHFKLLVFNVWMISNTAFTSELLGYCKAVLLQTLQRRISLSLTLGQRVHLVHAPVKTTAVQCRSTDFRGHQNRANAWVIEKHFNFLYIYVSCEPIKFQVRGPM